MRGAPGATDGAASLPRRVLAVLETYQLEVPPVALLSSPIGEFFGGESTAGGLDILQGNPSRIRDLAVRVASLRAIRAETPATVPLVGQLQLIDGSLKGTVRNAEEKLEKPAIVIGGSVESSRTSCPESGWT